MKILLKQLHIILYATSLILLVGCGDKQHFNSADFGEQVNLEAQEITLETTLRAKDLWAVGDSIIIVHNQAVRDSMYLVVDAKNWVFFSTLKDQIADSRLVKCQSHIMVYDPMPSRISIVNTDGKVNSKIWSISMDEYARNLFCEDYTFVYEGFKQRSSKSLIRYRGANKVTLSDFSEFSNITLDQAIHQGFIAVNPTSGRVAYAYKHLHRFDIFDPSGEVLSENINSSSPSPVIKEEMVDQANSPIYYNGAYATSERLYLYCVGLAPSEISETKTVTYVEEFDWDGNPIKRYELNDYYTQFVYVNGHFACITPHDNAHIDIYKLK